MGQHNWIPGMQREDKRIALYNADTKSVVGIFANACIAAKFVYGITAGYTKSTTIIGCCSKKGKLRKSTTVLDFNVAARSATVAQIDALDKEKYVFFDGIVPPADFVQNIKFRYP